MADVAQLGFSVDSSGLDKASDSLEALVPAAKAAETAAENVSDALNDASASAANVSAAAKGTSTQTAATAKVIQAATGAVNATTTANKNGATAATQAANSNNNLAHSHAGLSAQAMAAQHSIRSLVEGLASGMPPSMVLTQQLNHLAFAASGPGGIKQAFSDAIGMFSKFISGTALVVLGIGAIVVAFGAMAISVVKSEVALDSLAQTTNTTLAALHGLQQAASFKGISTDDFAKGASGFATAVNEAQHNMGSLNGLMIANNMQAKTFQQYLMNVADLVSKTADGQQKIQIIQAAGLPATQQWVNFLSQGSAGIQKAVDGTVQFNTAAEQNLIAKAKEFDDAWNKSTTEFSNRFKSAMVDALGYIDQINKQIISLVAVTAGVIAVAFAPISLIVTTLAATIAAASAAARIAGLGSNAPMPGADGQVPKRIQITGGTTDTKKPDPVTDTQAQHNIQVQQQQIAMLGDLATVTQQVTAKRLELKAAGLQGVGVGKTLNAQILLGVQAQAEQNRVNQQAQAGIFDLQAAQKAASDTLQHWIDQGLVDKTNAQQMAAAHQVLANNIKNTANAAAVAASPLQQLKQLEFDSSDGIKQFDTAATGALNNLVQPIQDTLNGVTSLSDGFKNMGVVVLQAIQQMIIKMLILAPIAQGLQSIFGGWTSLFGGGASSASSFTALGAAVAKNAKGGVYSSPSLSAYSGQIVSRPTLFAFASGAGVMGEAGPEGILPLKRGPSGSLGVQMFGGNQSSSNDNNSTQITYAPSYTLGGSATQEDLQNLRKEQAKDRAQFTANVVTSMQQIRKRNIRV